MNDKRLSQEEINAGKKIIVENIMYLNPDVYLKMSEVMYCEKYGIEIPKRSYRDYMGTDMQEHPEDTLPIRFVSNVALYYDTYRRMQLGEKRLGDEFVLQRLAFQIDSIMRYDKSAENITNSLPDPMNFDYKAAVVRNGTISNFDEVERIVRYRYIPMLMGNTSEEDYRTGHNYEELAIGIALGLAYGIDIGFFYHLAVNTYTRMYNKLVIDMKKRAKDQ